MRAVNKRSLTDRVQFCTVLPGWVNYSERQSCTRIWKMCLYYLINFFCLFFVSLLVLCEFCAHFDFLLWLFLDPICLPYPSNFVSRLFFLFSHSSLICAWMSALPPECNQLFHHTHFQRKLFFFLS